MFSKLRKPRLILSVMLTLFAFVAVGYFSNTMTSSACERATARWLDDILSRHPSDWPGRHAYSEPAEYKLPWIVAVDYGWAVADCAGKWGTRYYITLFGIQFPVGNHVRVVS